MKVFILFFSLFGFMFACNDENLGSSSGKSTSAPEEVNEDITQRVADCIDRDEQFIEQFDTCMKNSSEGGEEPIDIPLQVADCANRDKSGDEYFQVCINRLNSVKDLLLGTAIESINSDGEYACVFDETQISEDSKQTNYTLFIFCWETKGKSEPNVLATFEFEKLAEDNYKLKSIDYDHND
jgi:hypothetical protein